jgi:hypothetical protein
VRGIGGLALLVIVVGMITAELDAGRVGLLQSAAAKPNRRDQRQAS